VTDVLVVLAYGLALGIAYTTLRAFWILGVAWRRPADAAKAMSMVATAYVFLAVALTWFFTLTVRAIGPVW
jgi:hypothetical protein